MAARSARYRLDKSRRNPAAPVQKAQEIAQPRCLGAVWTGPAIGALWHEKGDQVRRRYAVGLNRLIRESETHEGVEHLQVILDRFNHVDCGPHVAAVMDAPPFR